MRSFSRKRSTAGEKLSGQLEPSQQGGPSRVVTQLAQEGIDLGVAESDVAAAVGPFEPDKRGINFSAVTVHLRDLVGRLRFVLAHELGECCVRLGFCSAAVV